MRRFVVLVGSFASILVGACSLMLGDGYVGGVRDAGPEVSDALDGATRSRYESAVLADAPVLYLRLGERVGGTASTTVGTTNGSYSLTGLDLGVPGALAGEPDTAVAITGGAGGITMPAGVEFEGLQPFAVEVWVKAAGGPGYGMIVDHEQFTVGRTGWVLRADEFGIFFERRTAETARSEVSGPPAPIGKWRHVATSFDGLEQALFLDGVKVDERDSQASISRIDGPYTIGRQNCATCENAFLGSLDELAIYDHALTEDQIRAHVSAAK